MCVYYHTVCLAIFVRPGKRLKGRTKRPVLSILTALVPSSKLHSPPVVSVSRLGTVGISFGKSRAEGRKEERETTRDHTIVPSFTGKGGNGVTVFPPSFLPALTAAAAGATLLDSMCDGSVSRSQGEESVLIVSTGIEGTHSTYK